MPSTLHQQVAVYHEERAIRPVFWEMVEAESQPFLPTTNVAEASLYNPSIGILQCLRADENGRPIKVTAQKFLEQRISLTKEEWDMPYIFPTLLTPVMLEQRRKNQVVAVRSLIKRLLVYEQERK